MKSIDKATLQKEADDSLLVYSFDGALTMHVYLSNICDDEDVLERCAEMALAEDEKNLSLTFKLQSVLDSAIAIYEAPGGLSIEAKPLIDCLKGELESMLERINGLEYAS